MPLLSRCVLAMVSVTLTLCLTTRGLGVETTQQHILLQAIGRGDSALVANLLRRGTPANVQSADGTTALMVAALHGNARMVELLLSHGAQPQAANDDGATALLWGAPDARKVHLLIDHGADVNARSALGNTPLMVASGSPDGASSVQQMLASGADITSANKGGRTALRFASDGGNVDTVRLLLAKAQEMSQLKNVIDGAGRAVSVAASNGFHDIVNVLLEHGADPNQEIGSRGSALNSALLAGNAEIARTLILHGCELDHRTQPGDVTTAVLSAYSERDDVSIAHLLNSRGADFSAANDSKETALTWARLRGHRQLIDWMVELGVHEGELPDTPDIPARGIDLHAGNRAKLIVAAVQKSIDLLQVSSDTFLDIRRNCVSCHHQNLPGVALAWARDRGFRVSQSTLQRMNDRQEKSWMPRVDRAYQLDSPYPVPPRFLGYGMWSFAELGYQANELTRSVSWYLAATQQVDGRWVPGMLRPPLGGSEILATILAMRSLQLYPLSGREDELAQRVDRAREWLENEEPRTHQERVYRTLGLAWAGVPPQELVNEVQDLLSAQRQDGGWAQLPNLKADAWATGQTLVALHVAGGLPTTAPAYQRGVEMLLNSQFDDGSWFVQSRSWPFQPYFESKFPHSRDQWISAPATAWASMALTLAVDPADVEQRNLPGDDNVTKQADEPLAQSDPPQLAPAATREVDFAMDIKPLFSRSCLGCHGNQKAESNFSLTSRAALIRGGDSELPAIVPGASESSPLVQFAAGLDSEMKMPPQDSRDQYPPLSADEISLVRAWIDQGADWPAHDSTQE